MKFPDTALQSAAGREAIRIIDRLRHEGFVAVLAGGCVRDALLGRTPKDFDVATDATPDSVQRVFGRRHTIAFGASFGVIGVLPPLAGERSQNSGSGRVPTEVATFRADGIYSDGRHPDHVTYGTAEADAARRDFTINGLFYDPSGAEVLDYVGGLVDLQNMHLRTIGEADRRFEEDKLRMLRAVRFVSTLGLTVESSTMSAIRHHADTLSVVSGERIGAEMRRVLAHSGAASGLHLLVEMGLHRHVWPGLEKLDWPRLQTCLARLDSPSFPASMAITLATLHENPTAAQRDLRELTKRWRLSSAEQRAIAAAINLSPSIIRCHDLAWSRLQPILIDRDIEVVVEVAGALTSEAESAGVQRAKQELQRDPASLNPPPLLSGDDLIAAGIAAGPEFRKWLAEIRRQQLDQQMQTHQQAMAWVQTEVNR